MMLVDGVTFFGVATYGNGSGTHIPQLEAPTYLVT